MEKIIVFVGPTCSGKTTLSNKIAEKVNVEIISADSRQIYKSLNIGTAKPDDLLLAKTKHHFIDELELDETFNASMFEVEAKKRIREIKKRNNLPLVVGGTGLYVKALIDGISESADSNDEIRSDLLNIRREKGNDYLYEELKIIDPESALKMLPQNWRRVIRAIEVFKVTGVPLSQHHKNQDKKTDFEFDQIGLLWDRELLYNNIEKRVDKMIEDGLIEEVKMILNSGWDKNLNSLNTVGYKEIINHLENEISLEKAIELIKRNSRRYAKRQLTWFRADKRINWFNVSSDKDINNLSEMIVKRILNERKN